MSFLATNCKDFAGHVGSFNAKLPQRCFSWETSAEVLNGELAGHSHDYLRGTLKVLERLPPVMLWPVLILLAGTAGPRSCRREFCSAAHPQRRAHLGGAAGG